MLPSYHRPHFAVFHMPACVAVHSGPNGALASACAYRACHWPVRTSSLWTAPAWTNHQALASSTRLPCTTLPKRTSCSRSIPLPRPAPFPQSVVASAPLDAGSVDGPWPDVPEVISPWKYPDLVESGLKTPLRIALNTSASLRRGVDNSSL